MAALLLGNLSDEAHLMRCAFQTLHGWLTNDFPEFVYTVILKPRPLRCIAHALLRAMIPNTKCIHGAVVCLNPNDPVVSGALVLGLYENAPIEFFRNQLRSGMQVVDIGANIGVYTAIAMKHVGPQGRVLSIEPDPESFRHLQNTISANDDSNRVTAVQKALSKTTGRSLLYLSQDNRGDNRLIPHIFQWKSISVETTTLDEVLEEKGFNTVDLIKIDVQGFEGKALKGMDLTLRGNQPLTMISEFWPDGLRQCNSEPMEYLNTLESYGFHLFELKRKQGNLIPVVDKADLIKRYSGRKYATIVAIK